MARNDKLSDVLKEMVRTVTTGGMNLETFEGVCKISGAYTKEEFYNKISLEIAQKYQDGLLSYDVSDDLMNSLCGVVCRLIGDNELDMPDLFYEIYEAFDAGEYHRTKDQSDNPIADYTDPMLRKILSRNS